MTTCVNKLTKTTENAPDSTQNNNKVSNSDHKIPQKVSRQLHSKIAGPVRSSVSLN